MTENNNGASRNGRGPALPPPSFTPAAGRPLRPKRTPAIEVGSPETGPQETRVAPQRVSGPQTNSQPVVPPARKAYPTGAYSGGQQPQSAKPAPQSFAPGGTPAGQARSQEPKAQPRQPVGAQHDSLPPSYGPGSSQRASAPASGQRQQAAAVQGDAQPLGQRPAVRHPQPASPPPLTKAKRSHKKTVALVSVLVIAALLAWPVGMLLWANGKLNHIEALSGAAATSGTTYLIAGSDSRENTDVGGNVPGARADTIMLLHVPEKGPSALISLPRDIYVPIPGYDSNKINASFSFGGAPLLVETVEQLTGMTVDHYVEVGFQGVEDIVDALGGVQLCYDRDVKDKESKLKWKAGCHVADGSTALAFSRMRKADPKGDIGRAERQRQVVSAIAKGLKSPSKLMNPSTQVKLVDAGTGALVVSEGTGFLDLGKMALAFQNANSDKGITGTPPIISLDYRPGGVGSAVQIDEAASAQFFKDIANGSLEPGEYNKLK
ncbi:LCP family protein [Timonella senegalensis]|uniref:LCP family protein n=1 Tax=Timonella senegalensis TaxID=1465825 RepID=UPI002FDC7DED